jgi:hypothetical protein
MPPVGFDPMIPAFERAKTFYALDRVAPVIGCTHIRMYEYNCPVVRHTYDISLYVNNCKHGDCARLVWYTRLTYLYLFTELSPS